MRLCLGVEGPPLCACLSSRSDARPRSHPRYHASTYSTLLFPVSCAGATFNKRSFTFGGFALSSQSIFLYVRSSEHPAMIWRPTDDSTARGNEIHAADIKDINGSGEDSCAFVSRIDGDLLG